MINKNIETKKIILISILKFFETNIHILMFSTVGLAILSWINPASNLMLFLRQMTHIFLNTIRRVVPSISGIDINLISLLIAGFGKLINEVLDILWWVVIIGAIGSWFMGFNSHPIFNLIDDICQPFYNIIRRILPPMSGLDFSPIILLVLITLTELILVPPIYHFASQF